MSQNSIPLDPNAPDDPGDSMQGRRTDDGLPMDVVQIGSRSWFCHVAPPGEQPVVILGIKTSSERVAIERCRELWNGIRDTESS